MGEFGGESNMGDGNVVHNEVEALRPLCQIITNETRDLKQQRGPM